MDRNSKNDQYSAYLALQKSRRNNLSEPIRSEVRAANPNAVNNPHLNIVAERAAATKIQASVRGHLTREQIKKDRSRPVFITNPNDAVFGKTAQQLIETNKFDVFAPNPDGHLAPLNHQAKRRIAPPEHTAILLHGLASYQGPVVKNLGSFKMGLKNRSAKFVADQLSESNTLPTGKNKRITSMACWSGVDNSSRRNVKDNELSFAQKLADSTRMPVTAPNGPVAIGSGTNNDFPAGFARVNLNMNDAGVSHSASRTFESIIEGKTALHSEKTTKPGGKIWRKIEPR